MPAWITSELRELVWVPIASSASRITTSRPASASARATASPTTPAPITTASILSMARGMKSGRQCITIRIAFSWPGTRASAAGSSGSTAAAPSPTSSRGGRTARSQTHKLLSQDPARYADAALAGIRHVLGLERGEPIPPGTIEAVKMGTTVATNALLERTGERTALFITRGFRDALRIAYQNRPRLFERHIVLPEMLYEQGGRGRRAHRGQGRSRCAVEHRKCP